ncbi:MAG: extracellular solute-binding protein [Lachnospiraceae bacterium]|nr:extracellular solute-binding protein [Lachnospiraceae bacterium]
MRLKKFLAGALATAMVAGLVGCGGGSTDTSTTDSSTPSSEAADSDSSSDDASTDDSAATGETKDVTLTVWGPQEDQAPLDGYDDGILKYMCDKFNDEHPEWNITFEYGVCSEGDAKNLVTKDVSTAADVYMFANDQIPELVSAGALAELGGSTVDTLKSEQSETMVESVTYQDGIYGVPFTSNTWFMYYDKSKFDESDVKSLESIMEKDLGDGVANFAFPLDNSWYIAAFYYGAGGTLFGDGTDENGGCTFDDENGVAMTKYLVELAANPKFSNEKDGSSIAKFKDGKLGAYCSGSWDAAAIQEALGDNFAATQIPTVTVNGTEGQLKSFAGSKAIGVNPQCTDPEVAVALAAYLGSEECQQIRFDARGIIPTNNTVAASDAVKSDVVATAQANEIDNASVVQPMLTAMGSYWTPAETMGKELVQGDVTADNAEEKTQAMVKGILGQ